MGCNCKKKIDTITEKYSDGEATEERQNIFQKIGGKIVQFIFGILFSAIIIVMTVPFLIFVCAGLILGKDININLNKILRIFGHKG